MSVAHGQGIPSAGSVAAPSAHGASPMPAAATNVPGPSPLPINLATALQLAGARPIDVAMAVERVRAAEAQWEQAHFLWLPTIYWGVDYSRHDGQIQAIEGNVFTTSRSAFLVGAGPAMTFAVTDAIYAPLAARQVLRARQAGVQSAINDTTLMVAEAYFGVQQARGELAGAWDALRRGEEVVRQTAELAPGLTPEVEIHRARAELARLRQAVEFAYDRWQTASADLTRILRLTPTAVVEPIELPQSSVQLVDTATPVEELIGLGHRNRPEIAARQAFVDAQYTRARQEKMRPWLPSVLVRGNAANIGGTLSAGLYGGGLNDEMNNFNGRHSIDVQFVWEWRNLGLGNRALVRERASEEQLANWELSRLQEAIAAEIVQSHAQARRAANRRHEAEWGLREALETADKIITNMAQTRRIGGDTLMLVFRPQEVVAATRALAQSYADYYQAVADANRAQFRLYRALGNPAQDLAGRVFTEPSASVHSTQYSPSVPPSAPIPQGMP